MPEKGSPEKDPPIPPPLDPFPTYQTPYPRPDKENENPFIQFRRFADDQFSSFFQGVPRMLGFQPRKDVDDMMRQRQEWQEGWRKQVEQEMEEMRQMLQGSKSRSESMERLRQHLESTTPDGPESTEERTDKIRRHQLETPGISEHAWTRAENASSSPQDTAPWWTRGAAARCPALNGTGSQGNSSKCPALYDDNGQAKTELDAYDTLRNTSNGNDVPVFQAPVQDTLHQQSKSWFSSFGWDGRQRTEASGDDQGSKDGRNQALARPARPKTYTMFGSHRMDPFTDTDDTIPWLLLSKYSPVYLCNPSQPRLFKVRIQDAEGVPFQIYRPRLFQRWYSEVDERLARRLPWADAFEDLLSLQQTGEMVDRDCSTWRTPSTWIHDMVHRGSLGSRWGFNQDGLLMKRLDDTNTTLGSPHIKDHCKRERERRWGCRRHNEEKPSTTPSLKLTEKEEDFIDDVIDKATEPLAPFPIFGSVLSAADSIVSAVEAAQEDFEKAQAATEKQFQPEQTQTIEEAPTPVLSTSSSSSYSYESSFFSSGQSTDSAKHVVATTTSTTERTLPDGSVETKRTYKQRFADGTEESDESVEVRNIPRAFPSPLEDSTILKQTHEQEPTVVSSSPDRHDRAVSLATSPDSDDTLVLESLKDDPHQPSKASAPLQQDRQSEGETAHQQKQDGDGTRRPGRGGWFWT